MVGSVEILLQIEFGRRCHSGRDEPRPLQIHSFCEDLKPCWRSQAFLFTEDVNRARWLLAESAEFPHGAGNFLSD
jgi:hypothetical protein